MKFVVKNVPPHKGGCHGEDLICSLTEDKNDRFHEMAHTNDDCEEGPCSESRDNNDRIYQHRVYDAPDTDVPSQYIYMWIDCRTNFDKPKKLELKDNFCGYPAYYYSGTPLMSIK